MSSRPSPETLADGDPVGGGGGANLRGHPAVAPQVRKTISKPSAVTASPRRSARLGWCCRRYPPPPPTMDMPRCTAGTSRNRSENVNLQPRVSRGPEPDPPFGPSSWKSLKSVWLPLIDPDKGAAEPSHATGLPWRLGSLTKTPPPTGSARGSRSLHWGRLAALRVRGRAWLRGSGFWIARGPPDSARILGGGGPLAPSAPSALSGPFPAPRAPPAVSDRPSRLA